MSAEEAHRSARPPDRVAALFDQHYPPGHPARDILWQHSAAVASLSLEIGQAQGARLDFLEEAAWLHDIGIAYTHAPGIGCHGDRPYLCHGVIGRELCEQAGFPEHGLVCETHVGTGLTAAEVQATGLPLPVRDMLPASLEEQVVCYADQFFSKSSSDRLDLAEVRRRVGRHGEAPLRRFEALHSRFGKASGGQKKQIATTGDRRWGPAQAASSGAVAES